jgi:hypothetical protein
VNERSTASARSPGLVDTLKGAMGRLIGLFAAPFWVLSLFTGAKSFSGNPILGSTRLNRLGLHAQRLKAAHSLARWRRSRLRKLVPEQLRQDFDRDGFIVVRDVLPPTEFDDLRTAILQARFDCRAQQQGDTITRRVAVGPQLRREIPVLDRLLRDATWRGLMAYVAARRWEPLYYIQTICAGVVDGPLDPQLEYHSDTFHPSLKAWFFLTDVEEDGCPLTYVAGSHKLSAERLEWERQTSIDIASKDRLSQRGSFRISAAELTELGLPQPTRFCVPANSLVVADTCGFHARAQSDGQAVRVELWAYARPSPFVPWVGRGPLSLPFIPHRKAELLQSFLDLLDRSGLRKQHWKRAGRRRPIDA